MKKFNSTIIVSFMGTDGSGKSTLIKKLSNQLKNSYRKIKYLHLRPYLFLTDKRTTNTNPHDQKLPVSQLESFIKILIWLFMYHVFFLINLNRKNQLIVFDRYAHDLIIDKIRYRFNLPNKLTRFILNLFPKPNLWIICKAPIKLIEKRKKELSTNEIKRQMTEYINFFEKQKNKLVIDTSHEIKKNILLITKKMKSIIK